MASRFVSAGAIDPTTGEAAKPVEPTTSDGGSDSRDHGVGPAAKAEDEWAAVQRELEAERKRREEQRAAAMNSAGSGPGGEKSLYEILQENKAAKQAAFEEANRIKNQFRPLDDDEAEFLDGVRAQQRQAERRLREETEERLRAFRAAQRGATSEEGVGGVAESQGPAWVGGEGADDGDAAVETETWTARKRKRDREKDRERERHGVRGLVRRRTASGDQGTKAGVASEARRGSGEPARQSLKSEDERRDSVPERKDAGAVKSQPVVQDSPKPKGAAALGLVDYGSSDEDD
ncbi:hypothetical protein VTK73DRAFT_4247 [Phialemonium thermophilum]|uniref:FAM192A/Fyv6 N-terminal domain-containing protein n=1 Tax=Phialemonium thermophilum TaxID=223376 RepID=A0ABR3WUL1_9PEZI